MLLFLPKTFQILHIKDSETHHPRGLVLIHVLFCISATASRLGGKKQTAAQLISCNRHGNKTSIPYEGTAFLTSPCIVVKSSPGPPGEPPGGNEDAEKKDLQLLRQLASLCLWCPAPTPSISLVIFLKSPFYRSLECSDCVPSVGGVPATLFERNRKSLPVSIYISRGRWVYQRV